MPHDVLQRVLVYKREQWYCLMCKQALQDVEADPSLIECRTEGCERYQWELQRPDMASCEIVGMGQGATIPSRTTIEISSQLTQHRESVPENKSDSRMEATRLMDSTRRVESADASS